MLQVWRAADDIEMFESGWTSDHFYPPHSADPALPRLEGWITLTALAQATSRLRMGTLVTGIHYRHPAVLANMAATLDIVSGGRLELGLGTGWNQEESSAYGTSWAPRKSAATGSKRRARSSPVCSAGRARRSKAATTSRPAPAATPSPCGGRTRRCASAAVARSAHCAPPPASHSTGTSTAARSGSSPARDVLHQHCADIRRDPAEILLSSQVRFSGDPAATAATAAAELGEAGAELAIVLAPPYTPAVLEPLATAPGRLA